MDWQRVLEFCIEYLSWPITILIAILIFRKKIDRMIRFKAHNYELTFEDELKSIKYDIKYKPHTTIRTSSNKKPDSKLSSTELVKENMFWLAEKSPLGVVLQSWGIMEHTIVECADLVGFKNISNPSAVIQYLYDNKYISESCINLYFRLYALKERYSNLEMESLNKDWALEIADIMIGSADDIKEYIEIRNEAASIE